MPAQPRPSVVDATQLSSLTSDQVSHLVNGAGPDFAAKGYGKAVLKKQVTGAFILNANEVDLSLLFSQMGVDAVDMPALRNAVSSWKADPAQVFSCLAQAAAQAAAPVFAPSSASATAPSSAPAPAPAPVPAPVYDDDMWIVVAAGPVDGNREDWKHNGALNAIADMDRDPEFEISEISFAACVVQHMQARMNAHP
jgi:hypothetical protein